MSFAPIQMKTWMDSRVWSNSPWSPPPPESPCSSMWDRRASWGFTSTRSTTIATQTAVALARAGIPLHILQRQLGHKHIEMTMKYATFHPDYNDVAPHFERMGRMLGLYSANGYDDVEGSSGGTLGNTPLQEGEMVGVERA